MDAAAVYCAFAALAVAAGEDLATRTEEAGLGEAPWEKSGGVDGEREMGDTPALPISDRDGDDSGAGEAAGEGTGTAVPGSIGKAKILPPGPGGDRWRSTRIAAAVASERACGRMFW